MCVSVAKYIWVQSPVLPPHPKKKETYRFGAEGIAQ